MDLKIAIPIDDHAEDVTVRDDRLAAVILIGIGAAACLAAYILMRRGIIRDVPGTSVSGAIAHNIGQVLIAALTLKTPALLTVYLPVLVGVGAVVGSLTGIIAERVFQALRLKPAEKEK